MTVDIGDADYDDINNGHQPMMYQLWKKHQAETAADLERPPLVVEVPDITQIRYGAATLAEVAEAMRTEVEGGYVMTRAMLEQATIVIEAVARAQARHTTTHTNTKDPNP